jgi:hypothetical protein
MEMRRLGFRFFLCACVAATLVLMVSLVLPGCNWGGVGSDTWTDNTMGVDFSGVYVPSTGDYLITNFTNASVAGSSPPISSMVVAQTGNKLTFTDSNGAQYVGMMSSVTTPTAGGSNLLTFTSSTVIGNFQVSGKDINGQGFTIAGAFYGDYNSGSIIGSTGTLDNRSIEGTWIAADGQTGNIYGVAGGTTQLFLMITN